MTALTMAARAQKLAPLARRCSQRIPLEGLCLSAYQDQYPFGRRSNSGFARRDETEQDLEASPLGKRLDQAFEDYWSQKLAPSWLPLRPEASYWIPPSPILTKMLDLSGRAGKPLTNTEIVAALLSNSWTSIQTGPGSQPEAESITKEVENVILELQATASESDGEDESD